MCKRLAGVVQLHAGHQQAGKHGKHVGGIETAQQGNVEFGIAPVSVDVQVQARLRQAQRVGDHGAAPESVAGDARRTRFAFELLAEGIVDIDHDPFQSRPAEQARLGMGIVFHVAVIIEMIARQIGQHCDIERRAVDAPLREAVRGHFHCARDGTLLPVMRKTLLQLDGIGSGIERRRERAGKAVADGADDGGFAAQLRQGLRNPVRDRGLAVGAGDADHVQRARRLAIHMGRDFADAGLQADHAGIGNPERRIPLIVVGLPQHAVDALRHGLRNEIPAIAGFARIGGEYHARHRLAAIADESGDRYAEPFEDMRNRFPDCMGGGRHGGGMEIRHHTPPLAASVFWVTRVAVSGASGGSAN